MKRVSVTLDERTVAAFDRVAKSQERSRAWLLRKVLEAAARGEVRGKTDSMAR